MLCRRELGEVIGEDAGGDRASRAAAAWLLFVLVLGVGGGAAAWVAREAARPVLEPRAAASAEPAPARAMASDEPEPEPAAAPPAQPDQQPMAADDPEAPERERPDAEREPQSAQALAQRKLEEEARDRARHEQVMRDLDAMSRKHAREQVQITMYSTSWCGVCSRARAYMTDKRIAFQDFDIERDEAARDRARALNPRGGVPTIVVDDQLLIGFSPGSLEQSIDSAARRRQGS